MDKENKHITDFDLKIIADYFRGLDRQGPGGDDQTLKALSFIPNLSEMGHIADIGCGTGTQTSVLASQTRARITANDLLPEMLEGAKKRAGHDGYADRLTVEMGSMGKLPFATESQDLIWAEGSIYNIGFERGFTLWRKFLKPGGYIGVTECCWLTPARPTDLTFMRDNFPDIGNISEKIAVMEKTGYMPVASFVLPEYCWTDNYYTPMENGYMHQFLLKHNNSPTAVSFVDRMKDEIRHYKAEKNHYGYVFFVAKKV